MGTTSSVSLLWFGIWWPIDNGSVILAPSFSIDGISAAIVFFFRAANDELALVVSPVEKGDVIFPARRGDKWLFIALLLGFNRCIKGSADPLSSALFCFLAHIATDLAVQQLDSIAESRAHHGISGSLYRLSNL